MRWQRYVWTVIVLAIWIISLLIVDSAAKQTRMGYQQQNLQIEQQKLSETNLRLKCELSVLHDLEKAEEYAEARKMVEPDYEDVIIATEAYGVE